MKINCIVAMMENVYQWEGGKISYKCFEEEEKCIIKSNQSIWHCTYKKEIKYMQYAIFSSSY